MKELQEHAKQLQPKNDRLRAQVKKRRDLDERDGQDSGHAKHPAVRDKGKKHIALDDVDTPADDELSSGSSPNPSPVKSKSNKDRTRQRHSHSPAFSNSNGGTLRRATSRGQNPPCQAPGNAFVLPTGTMLNIIISVMGTIFISLCNSILLLRVD